MCPLLPDGESVQVGVVYGEVLIVSLQDPRGRSLYAQLTDVVPPGEVGLALLYFIVGIKADRANSQDSRGSLPKS